ncbi:MAG: cystathionine gamma-synthase [Verrucomicrobiales bacterium]|nr:cystathionine gamma-synthase [Verrucomicrobiales bacterium]
MNKTKQSHFETVSIHAGNEFKEATGSIIPPIFATSTFESDNEHGFDYTRSGNPNFTNLEQVIAKIEKADCATVFASGVSAITAVLSTLNKDSKILAEENIYGCTYRLIDQVFSRFGVSVEYIDFTNKKSLERISEVSPDLVWIESPTNPLLKIIDIEAIANVTRDLETTLVVDNTFSSSFIQCPLELGADLSLLSLTKYTNGHSDALGGAVCSKDKDWGNKMIFAQKALGLQPSPFDCWLIQRGLKTQSLRMEKHSNNAYEVAKYLEVRFPDKKIIYPFLESHPQYKIARKQMKMGSGIITADLGLGLEKTVTLLSELQFFTKAESLGGIESLSCHPASMTHSSIPKEVREGVGITDSLFRLSIGIENAADLIVDLGVGLDKVGA